MTELSQFIFTVLFGMLGLYLVIFWGVVLASLACSYVHDGEKDYSAFYKSKRWTKVPLITLDRTDCTRSNLFDVLYWAGLSHPILVGLTLIFALAITEDGGGAALAYISLTIIGVCALLRVTRTVVRLSKRFLAHEKDVSAHEPKD